MCIPFRCVICLALFCFSWVLLFRHAGCRATHKQWNNDSPKMFILDLLHFSKSFKISKKALWKQNRLSIIVYKLLHTQLLFWNLLAFFSQWVSEEVPTWAESIRLRGGMTSQSLPSPTEFFQRGRGLIENLVVLYHCCFVEKLIFFATSQPHTHTQYSDSTQFKPPPVAQSKMYWQVKNCTPHYP